MKITGCLLAAFALTNMSGRAQVAVVPAITLSVDPVTGSDSGDGSSAHPFRSIERARDAARAAAATGKSDVIVLLHGGRYELTRTISFGPDDSGAIGHEIVYRAAPGERPVLSGGRLITGWKPAPGGLYQATVPKFLHFRQLYVNGRRAIRSGSPPTGQYIVSRGWDPETRTLLVAAKDVPKFSNDAASPAEIVAQVLWSVDRLRLAAIEPAPGGMVRLVPQEPERTMVFNKGMPPKWPGQYLRLENSLSFVDEPGEWYLRASTGDLFYKPRQGETMATAEVVIPVITTLFDIRGTYSRPVRGLRFEGLTFEHANFLAPDTFGFIDHQASQYAVRWNLVRNPSTGSWDEYQDMELRSIDPAVRMTLAQSVHLKDDRFRNLGGNAVNLEHGCRDCSVVGCSITDVAGNGVQEGIFDGNPPEPQDATANDRITNNFISRIGLDYPGSVGIMGAYTRSLMVAHNEVVDVPYTGISVGWGWTTADTWLRDNTIRGNRIVHSNALLNDGAGIYTLSKQPGTVIEGNVIEDSWLSPWAPYMNVAAIYLDEGSSDIAVRGNAWRNVEQFTNGTVERHIAEGHNVFADNPPADGAPSDAGLEPAFVGARTVPVASPFPQAFTEPLSISLMPVAGATIHYTLDGSKPELTSATYQNPILLAHSSRLRALAFGADGRAVGSEFSGDYPHVARIIEDGTRASIHESRPIIVGATQRIGRSDYTGFSWGGHVSKPGNPKETMLMWEAGDNRRLIFNSAGPDHTAVTPGTYVYTIFSPIGSNAPAANGPDMRQGRLEVRLVGGDPVWLKSAVGGPPWPMRLRALVRDRAGHWYLSTAESAADVVGWSTARLRFASAGWQRVNPATEAAMNRLRQGEDPGAIRPLPGAAAPDLTELTGGGVYLDAVAHTVSWLQFSRITWIAPE